MKKKDVSYGIVPFVRSHKGALEFLLVYQKEKFRGFPKGHLELGESPQQAALRELREETGLSDCIILDGKIFMTNYQFRDKCGNLIDKNAYFMMGEIPYDQKHQMHIDNYEVVDAFWWTYEQCKELLTHQTNKEILDQVYRCLTL